ncbi:MAG: hypothetical protein U1E83_10965 [Methylotetracoccus sp.]
MRFLSTRLACAVIPILSGCQTGTALDDYLPGEPPTVTGSPGAPPRQVQSVVVWGNDERTVEAASAWIKQHGIRVVPSLTIHQALAAKSGSEELLITEGTVLDAAGQAGADAVVFADRTGDVRPPMVSVKAVGTRNRATIWTGDARFDKFYGLPNAETMTLLTDHALMTAWGLQPKED